MFASYNHQEGCVEIKLKSCKSLIEIWATQTVTGVRGASEAYDMSSCVCKKWAKFARCFRYELFQNTMSVKYELYDYIPKPPLHYEESDKKSQCLRNAYILVSNFVS